MTAPRRSPIVLHAGGVFGDYALDSTELECYGQPGPGRYVTIYANAAHAFMYVAGLRFDTVEDPAYDSGPELGQARPDAGGSPHPSRTGPAGPSATQPGL